MIFRYLAVAATVVLILVPTSHLCRSTYAEYAGAAFTAYQFAAPQVGLDTSRLSALPTG